VVWPAKGLPEEAAGPYLGADHWDLRDVIAIVETGKKAVSSLEGHRRADTSPHFARRQELLPARLAALGGSLRDRAFPAFASLLEEEAIELHLIAMSSAPPVYYWKPHTLAVMERVRTLRDEGLSCAFTMDAGANVHVICPAEAEPEVAEALGALPGVIDTIRDRVGAGPILDEKHLF
jgi:diphosphomevalonate decarboxylase